MSTRSANTVVGIDFISGTVGGISQVLVGHPFDTVKVNLQRSGAYATPIAAARDIMITSGIRGFFAGVGPPLCTVAAFNALLFSVTGSLHRLLRPDGGPLNPSQAAFTGALAGPAVSLLAAPTELLKCRLQAQGALRPPPGTIYTLAEAQAGDILYKGPVDAMILIMRFEGGGVALFRGFTPTLLREIPGNAAYFGAYTFVKEQLAAAQGLMDTSRLGAGSLMVAGGVAGAAFWIPTIPADTIKTRLQLDSPYNPKYRGIVDCAQKLIQSEGWGSLFRGWQPCLARSVPANAALFMTYEVTHKMLESLVHSR